MTVTRDGKTFSQRAHKPTDPNVPTDTDGVPIKDALKPAFTEAAEIERWRRKLSRIDSKIKEHAEKFPAVYRTAVVQDIHASIKHIQQDLLEEKPAIVCCYCGADNPEGCTECGGRGFLRQKLAWSAREDLRNMNRKTHGIEPLAEGMSQHGQ